MYLLGHLMKFFCQLIYLIKESLIVVKHFCIRRKTLLLSVVVIPPKKMFLQEPSFPVVHHLCSIIGR